MGRIESVAVGVGVGESTSRFHVDQNNPTRPTNNKSVISTAIVSNSSGLSDWIFMNAVSFKLLEWCLVLIVPIFVYSTS